MAKENIPNVIFRLKDNYFSISSEHVLSIIKEPKITIIPNSPNYIKGIFTYRDETYKLIDLRNFFSIVSISEELNEFKILMDKRAEDHKKWLNELESSILEKRKFGLTTDPHKCAFGMWYDVYCKEEKRTLREMRILDQFDKPHQTIHKIAEKVNLLTSQGNYDKSHEIIEKTRLNELSSMISLFDETKKQFEESTKQLSILIKLNDSKVAIAVDFVDSIDYLDDVDISGIKNSFINPQNNKYFLGLGNTSDDKMVIKLSAQELIYN